MWLSDNLYIITWLYAHMCACTSMNISWFFGFVVMSLVLFGGLPSIFLSLVYSSVLVSSEGTHHSGLNYLSPYSSG